VTLDLHNVQNFVNALQNARVRSQPFLGRRGVLSSRKV